MINEIPPWVWDPTVWMQYTKTETYVFDATASINDPGRYINHARRICDLVLMPPVKIGVPLKSQLKISFVAKKTLKLEKNCSLIKA